MSTSNAEAFALPARLAFLGDREWTPVTLGKSGDMVWKIVGATETLFLKSSRLYPGSEHPGEVERLRWLAATGIPAPAVRDAFEADDHGWLLMTALLGRDLTHFTDRPTELIEALATCLRTLHRLDVATCPFDQSLDTKLAAGAANAAAGLVDETDFDVSLVGTTAAHVLDWLQGHRPDSQDLVVCHGDASLPNIMADGRDFTGIIDCGRLGIADRWQDLAIACRSIIYNCGEAYVPAFLATYGADWNEELYRYYRTLDELF